MNIWQKLKRDLTEGWFSRAERRYLREFRERVERLNRRHKQLKKKYGELEKEYRRLKKKQIPAPRIFGTIHYRKLYDLLKAKIDAPILLADRKYQLTSTKEMRRFLKEDKTDLIKYISVLRDCDDISWSLLGAINQGKWAGIAFGFAWSDTHAFNIFVSDKRKIKIIEAQTDDIYDYDKVKKPYKPIRLVMM